MSKKTDSIDEDENQSLDKDLNRLNVVILEEKSKVFRCVSYSVYVMSINSKKWFMTETSKDEWALWEDEKTSRGPLEDYPKNIIRGKIKKFFLSKIKKYDDLETQKQQDDLLKRLLSGAGND